MSKLVWDAIGERYYETGVKKGVLYVMEGTTYSKGVAWNGLTAVTESPSGAEATPLYADDIKYLNLTSNEEFGGTIEAYTYPDEFKACNGEAELTTGVVLGQQPRKAFGLCYRTEVGDDAHPGMNKGYKLHFVYNCTVSPSGRGYATINNSPDAITFSWEASSTPTAVNDVDNKSYKAVSTVTVDETKFEDKTKIKALETMIYGIAAEGNGTATQAQMPTPNQIISMLS